MHYFPLHCSLFLSADLSSKAPSLSADVPSESLTPTVPLQTPTFTLARHLIHKIKIPCHRVTSFIFSLALCHLHLPPPTPPPVPPCVPPFVPARAPPQVSIRVPPHVPPCALHPVPPPAPPCVLPPAPPHLPPCMPTRIPPCPLLIMFHPVNLKITEFCMSPIVSDPVLWSPQEVSVLTEPESTPGKRDPGLSASGTPVVPARDADTEGPCGLQDFPDPQANHKDPVEAFVPLPGIEDKPRGRKRPSFWFENYKPVN